MSPMRMRPGARPSHVITAEDTKEDSIWTWVPHVQLFPEMLVTVVNCLMRFFLTTRSRKKECPVDFQNPGV